MKNRIGSGTMSDERTGQPGACPFFVLWPAGHQRERSDRTTPDTRTRSQRASAVGFEVVSRLPREPLSKPKPRPRRATPRHAERPEGEGGGATGRRRQGRRRRPPRRPVGPTKPGAKRRGPQAREQEGPTPHTAPKGWAPLILPRARTSVVSALKNGGVLRHPPMGDK